MIHLDILPSNGLNLFVVTMTTVAMATMATMKISIFLPQNYTFGPSARGIFAAGLTSRAFLGCSSKAHFKCPQEARDAITCSEPDQSKHQNVGPIQIGNKN